MDQYEVADQVGVSQSTYCDWENGRMRPQRKRLPILATVLKVRHHRLLQWWLAS